MGTLTLSLVSPGRAARAWVALAGLAAGGLAGAAIYFATAGNAGHEEPNTAPNGQQLAAPGDSRPISARTGSVTMADREAALHDLARCLEAAGLEGVAVVPGEGMRPGGVTFRVPAAEGQPRAADAVYRDCAARTTVPVETAWRQQQGVLSSEETEALHRRLEACVAAGGIPGLAAVGGSFGYYPNPPLRHLAIAREDLDKFWQCARREEETTGLKPPYPIPGTAAEVQAWLTAGPR
jgi:hypothetical protein